jgi:hypothetical protein
MECIRLLVVVYGYFKIKKTRKLRCLRCMRCMRCMRENEKTEGWGEG